MNSWRTQKKDSACVRFAAGVYFLWREEPPETDHSLNKEGLCKHDMPCLYIHFKAGHSEVLVLNASS